MTDLMDGLISFFSSYHAIRAEALLNRNGYRVELIPGPKELSPNCGVALRFEFDRRDAVLKLLEQKSIQVDSTHAYQPRTDLWVMNTISPASATPETNEGKQRGWQWFRNKLS